MLLLSATTRARPSERDAVCAHPDEGHDLRPVPSDLGADATCAAPEVGEVKLVGTRRRSVHEIGHPDPAFQKLAPFIWRQETIREASLVQRPPEAIAGPREMQPDRTRPEARVDSDEDHIKSGRDHVWNGLAVCRLELMRRGPIGNRLHHAAVSASMRRLVLVVAAIALVSCMAAPAPPPPSLRTDRVGNILPPLVDDATWARLAAHPLQLASLAPAARCPTTETAPVSPYTGPLAGPGPVYSAGNTLFYTRAADGTLNAKVAWISRPEYTGPALIRGKRIDSTGDVRFAPSGAALATDLRFEYDTRVRAGGSEEGWRFLPSTVSFGAPGCYAFQIDGLDWTVTIVMDTNANP